MIMTKDLQDAMARLIHEHIDANDMIAELESELKTVQGWNKALRAENDSANLKIEKLDEFLSEIFDRTKYVDGMGGAYTIYIWNPDEFAETFGECWKSYMEMQEAEEAENSEDEEETENSEDEEEDE